MVVGLALCAARCGPTVADEFRKAQAVGTVAAWRHFLAAHPDAQEVRAAREALDAAAFEHLLVSGPTQDAYEAYIEDHPEGGHVKDALEGLDDLAFARAMEAGSPDDYLDDYPRGKHADEARRVLDKDLLERAVEQGADALRGFVQDRPDSTYLADAWAALERALVREVGEGGLILWRVKEDGRQVGVDAVSGWEAGESLRLSGLDLGAVGRSGLPRDARDRVRLTVRASARRMTVSPGPKATAVLLLRVGDAHRVLTAPLPAQRSKRLRSLKWRFDGSISGLKEGRGRAYLFINARPPPSAEPSGFRPVSNIVSVPILVLARGSRR